MGGRGQCYTSGGLTNQTVHLSPSRLCLIFFSFVFVLHVQFCKAKSRCTLSQVVHQQHSVTVSYQSLLQYSLPPPPLLLSSPFLCSSLLASSPCWFLSVFLSFSFFFSSLLVYFPLLLFLHLFSPLVYALLFLHPSFTLFLPSPCFPP